MDPIQSAHVMTFYAGHWALHVLLGGLVSLRKIPGPDQSDPTFWTASSSLKWGHLTGTSLLLVSIFFPTFFALLRSIAIFHVTLTSDQCRIVLSLPFHKSRNPLN